MRRAALLMLLLAAPAAAEMPVARLDKALRAAGIPIAGVTLRGETATGVAIAFSTATTTQKAQAAQIVKNFDFSPSTAPTLTEILTKVQGLSAEQRDAILTEMMANYLLSHEEARTNFLQP
jgi:hypothetical protein